ncbi:hypothetical protein [Pseudomonas knackmussii]|uniref:hypothetical protein n=1 Tax=Pseudomonas knackmussii TaxID=65741 RepID=UPI003F4A783D
MCIPIALHYLGLPPNSKNPDDYDKAEALLRDNPALYPTQEVMSTLYPLETLPLRLERVRTRSWTKIKTGT